MSGKPKKLVVGPGFQEWRDAEDAIPKILAAHEREANRKESWWKRRWNQMRCRHLHVEPWYHAWYCLDCGKVTHD